MTLLVDSLIFPFFTGKMNPGGPVDLWGCQRALFVRVRAFLTVSLPTITYETLLWSTKRREDVRPWHMAWGAINQSLLWVSEKVQRHCQKWREGWCASKKKGGWNGGREWEGKRARKVCERKRFKDILWLLLPPVPVLAQPVLGPWRPLLIHISFSFFTGNGRVMCKWPCSPPLSLSISFPSSVSLGYAAIWLFIAARAELLDVSFGIQSWFNDFSIIPLHFLYVSFAPLEPLLRGCTLSSCIPCTLMFPLLPRTSLHSCLVSIIFISFFLTFLCFLLAQGAASHSETVDWAWGSASLPV